jgi:peptide/nickel transport system substrate-binding protein
MRRFLGILLSLSLVMMLFASVSPMGAEEPHELQKYIDTMTYESILPEVGDVDSEISAETFSAGLSTVLGKELSYEGENFTRAEMFKFAIDNNDALKDTLGDFDFPAWCLCLDDETIPEEYVPYFNMASRPRCNILTYRYRETAWDEKPTYAEASFLLYRFKYPPNTASDQMLTCVTQQEPDTLNPFVSSSMSRTFLVAFNGNLGSVDFGNDSILFPVYVLRRPSLENGDVILYHDEVTGIDKMKVIWNLRPGVFWPPHENEPEGSQYHELTADDVLFAGRQSFCPLIQSISRSGEWKIDKIVKTGKHQIEYQYNEEFAYGTWGTSYIDKSFFQKELITKPDQHNTRQDFVDHSFGPYNMVEWNQGNYMDFEPNPYAAFAQPLISKIRVKFMSETNTIKLNLMAREIDMVYNAFSPIEAKDLEDELSDTYKFYYVEGTGWEHIDLNQFADDPENEDDVGKDFLFGDKRVRQALLYALDREKLCKLVSKGVFTPSHLWLTRRSPYYKKAEEMGVFKKYEYNPKLAEELLDEVGWIVGDDGIREKDGVKFSFSLSTTSGNPFRLASVENIVKMWNAVGIEATSDFKTATVLFGGDYLRRHQFEATEFAWVSNPLRPRAQLFSREQIPTADNGWMGQCMGGWYGSDEHQLYVDTIEKELPDSELQDALNKEFAIWTDELPALPLYNRYNVDVTKYNLENYKPTGSQQPPNWNCDFWYLED